jgi:hypothetical protein
VTAVGNDGRVRTCVPPVMSGALETSSATSPWLATAESNRAIPAYQAGPVDRLGRGHCAEGGGPDPQRVNALPGSSRRLPWQLHLPWRMTEDPTPSPLPDPSRFERAAASPAASSSRADGTGLEPVHDLHRDHRLPAGHLAYSVSHPCAEGAGIEPAHDASRDLGLANRRLAARPTFRALRTLPGIRTLNTAGLSRRPLPLG